MNSQDNAPTASISQPLYNSLDNSSLELKMIMDSSVDVICTIDGNGYFLKVSAASFKMWGYTPEELIGLQSMDLVYKKDAVHTKQIFARIKSGVEMTNFENRFCCKDGSVLPIFWSARWNEEHQIMYAIARDGTEKLRNEKEQIVNQKRLNKAQQLAKLGSWEYNLLEGCTYWCSDELYNIYGINRAAYPEITLEVFSSLVHPEDKEPLLTELQSVGTYNDYCREHRIIRPDGQIVNIRLTIEVIKEGGIPICLIGIVQDITSQKIAEHLLVSSERRFRSLVQNGFDMISILDTEGNYIYASDSTFRILGHDPTDLAGRNAFDLVHPEDVIKTAKSFARLYKEAYVEDTAPFRFKNDKGEWRWLEVKAANLLYDPTINGFVINSRDITEKKLLQERLDRQMQEWQKKMSKAAIMAQEKERAQLGRELHDNVNQVLTTVKLYNELCLDTHSDQRLLLEKSVNYLNNCIDEIRTISKRLSTPTLGDISFEDSIKELINSLKLTDKVDIHLIVSELPKNLSQEIHLSIYRIVQEHMTNVFKHAEAKQVILCFSTYADAITVSIKDDGKGFNMKAKRNGIGISNMIGRAESLNGKLQIHSAPNKGCQLQLSIPLEKILPPETQLEFVI